MRGRHRRRRAPRRLIALRVAIAVAVPVFVVVQPTGASAPAARVLAPRAEAAVAISSTVPSTTSTSIAIAPTTTVVAPPVTTTTTRLARAITPTTRRASALPVALTFDDGPDETYTPQVLDILAHYGVRATFFVVGAEVERFRGLAQRILDEGHVLGNHTWDHADLTALDDEGFVAQVDRTQDLLTSLVGASVSCVRPPFGRTNAHVKDLARVRGLKIAKWTKDTEDWKEPGVSVIVQRALAGAEAGGVILFHDGGPDMSQTVAALPAIIEGIQASGLRIAPICAPVFTGE